MGANSGVIERCSRWHRADTAAPGDHTGGVIVQVGVPTVNAKGQRVTIYSRIVLPILAVPGR